MDRTEFEALRDIPGKIIEQDISFSLRQPLRPLLVAEEIVIENDGGWKLLLNINYNPEVGSKVFNVRAENVGPICRLCVDGTAHGDMGRSHKHSLQAGRCPDRNLPDGVIARPDLTGQTLRRCFEEFCKIAGIEHRGEFVEPT